VTRRNLGVSRKIELAEMATLPPLAQVIAEMDGRGSFGWPSVLPKPGWKA